MTKLELLDRVAELERQNAFLEQANAGLCSENAGLAERLDQLDSRDLAAAVHDHFRRGLNVDIPRWRLPYVMQPNSYRASLEAVLGGQ